MVEKEERMNGDVNCTQKNNKKEDKSKEEQGLNERLERGRDVHDQER